MREIKFRGKRTDNGEWIYGNLIYDEHFPWIVADAADWDDEFIAFEEWRRIDPATVGQYTGLCDRNGKQIFEGDVLDILGAGWYEVIFSEGCFGAVDGIGFTPFRSSIWGMGGVVIGNVWDNPELLEEG